MSRLDALIASIVSSSTSRQHSNSSDLQTRARELASLLSNGPALGSPQIGKVLVPIEQLCGPHQPPNVQAAGYKVVKALCSGHRGTSNIANADLKPLERRQVWYALRHAGAEWRAESSMARLEALEALIGVDQSLKKEEDTIDVEGLTDVLGEIRRWISSAVDSILISQERGRQGQTTQNSEKQVLVTRLDRLFHQIAKQSPYLLTEQETRSTIELYSTWCDRAVKDEYDDLQPMASVVSQTVRPGHFQGRLSTSTTPTTFTFPSSLVTPMEATLSLSRAQPSNISAVSQPQGSAGISPAYLFLGPLFLNLIQRFHANTVLIPIDSFPRIMSSMSFLIALTIKVLPTSGMWVAGISLGSDPYEKDRGSIDSAANIGVPPTRNFYASGVGTPRTLPRSANPQYAIMAIHDDIGFEGSNLQEEAKAKEIAVQAKVLINILINDQWYSASALQAAKHLLFPISSKATAPPQKYIISPYTAQGAARALRYSIVKALKIELSRAALNDIVANSYTMGGAPSLLDDIVRYETSWNQKVVGLGIGFEKIGLGLKDAVVAWRIKGIDAGDSNGLGGEVVLMELSGLVMDILSLCPKGTLGEVPRFAGELLQELAEVLKEYR